MTWIEPTRVTERVVLSALTLGFALVVFVLTAAGLVALRATRAIESDAAQMGREQLAMARLLNDLQAGQNVLGAALHRLGAGRVSLPRDTLLADLDAADRALARAAAPMTDAPETTTWLALGQAAREFSTGVRSVIASERPPEPGQIEHLLDVHDRVVGLERQLLLATERRLEAADRRIQLESRNLASNSRLLLGTGLLLAVVCAVVTIRFARSSIRIMESQASELSRVSWHLVQSQESLARRFSHELHDELGQSLAAIRANVANPDPAWQTRQADCVRLIDESIQNVRDLSQLLRPVILDDFGLDAGLRWLTEGFAQRTGHDVRYESNFSGRTTDDVETHLFRIAQEGLTNVARHAGATEVQVRLEQLHSRLHLTVADNGRGIAGGAGVQTASLGIIGMRARAREIGGEFHLSSQAGGGLRIHVVVPLTEGA